MIHGFWIEPPLPRLLLGSDISCGAFPGVFDLWLVVFAAWLTDVAASTMTVHNNL